jgi:hypothetical protein
MTATVHLYRAYFVLLFAKRYKFLSDALNLLKKVCHDFERKVLKILTKYFQVIWLYNFVLVLHHLHLPIFFSQT